jgi:tetratricopeptide (TPR) repeat protein
MWVRSLLPTLLGVTLVSCYGQQPYSPPGPTDAASRMQQHYELAYRMQDQGDLAQADAEHTAFLLAALESVATGYANTGDYPHAALVYDEALTLAPADFSLIYDYARAAIDGNDPRKTLALLKPVLAPGAAPLTQMQRSSALKITAKALYALGYQQAALYAYLAAAYSDPSYDNLYALAVAMLSIRGNSQAKPIFAAALRTYGDSARHHMDVGRAYGQSRYPDDAAPEFQRALELDPTLPTAHYSLGAAYMDETHANVALAEKEFREELALNPDDALSYQQLGLISQGRGDDKEAEFDFRRATELAPGNSSNFLNLGSLYFHLNRPQDAEPALRRAIELSVNPEHNFWEIQRAHYKLGRILSAKGNQDEAARELSISQSLLDRSRKQQEQRVTGIEVDSDRLEKTRIASPQDAAAFQEFLQHLTPLIAGSYNNLGVHAAMAGKFETATKQFALAAQWNPLLPGVNRNWARAAFAAHDCSRAMNPLHRAMEHDPSDAELNSMLVACNKVIAQ